MGKQSRTRRQRKQHRPVVRIVGQMSVEGDDYPVVEVAGGRHRHYMEVDRTIQAAGLEAWVRAVRPDDAPDPSRAINPTPEGLDAAAGFIAQHRKASHVLVLALAAGVRVRHFLLCFPLHSLN